MAGAIVAGEQIAGAVLALLFLGHYLWAVRYRFARRPLESWWLVLMNTSQLLVFTLAILTTFIGRGFPARDIVRASVYGYMVAMLSAQYALLTDALVRGRRHLREERSEQ
jgi:hypothetical protein